jgi:low temperature requirement protein LtrA
VASDEQVRVSTIELFFDLVFVFTITQVTLMITADPSLARVAQAELIFGNLWYMYGAYAWLTNATLPSSTGDRLLLLVGMGGFLLAAISAPMAFGDNGAVFGIAYLVLTLVNTVLFLQADPETVTRRTGRLRPFNLAAALLILAAGFAAGALQWAFWVLAFIVHWSEALLLSVTDVGVRSTHFVERHGLILLIALGESVIAVGATLSGQSLDGGDVAVAVLGLALVAALWWLYFDGDDDRAETRLAVSPPDERARLALYGYGYGFLLVLGGIILLAAGLHGAVLRDDEPLHAWDAVALGGGAALTLGGLALLRGLLRIGPISARLVAAGLACATIPVGTALCGAGQLAAVVAVIIGLAVVEGRHLAPPPLAPPPA